MPSLGLRPAVLLTQKAVFGQNSPQAKITPMGYLAYLLSQATPNILSSTIDDKSGYIKDVNVRFKKRAAAGTSVTVDGCTIEAEGAYYTQTMPALLKRYKGTWFDYPTIKQFTEDALASKQVGNVPTRLMQEVWDEIMAQANGLLLDINADLLAALAFGINVQNGLATTKTVNFPQNTSTLVMASGMTEVMSDAMLNEADIRTASIVGSGIINYYYLQQAAKGLDQSGMNSTQLALPKFYFDPAAATAFGANQFAVIEKDAVQFVNLCNNRATGIMGRLGTSEFGNLTLPIVDAQGNSFRNLEFDLQIKEVDCPASQTIAGVAASKGRGFIVILGCNYGTVQIPTTAYASADRLTGNRGTYRYTGTNT